MQDDELARAMALYRTGHRGDAAAILAGLLARTPGNPEALHLRGILALDAGDSTAALSDFERVLELRPDYAEAHSSLGHTLLERGSAEEALVAFRQAIRLQPALAMAHDGLGLAFQALRQWRAAAASHQRAVTLSPDEPTAWANLGNALFGLQQFDEAGAAHRRALQLRPGHAGSFASLGAALRVSGRLDEAIAAFREALAHQPDLVGVEDDLVATLRESGRPGDALAVLDAIRRRRPADAGVLFNVGAAFVELGRLQEGRSALQDALAVNPQLEAAHYALGNVLRDLGEIPAAVREFRAAVDLDPAFVDAWSNYLFTLNFAPGQTDEVLCRANRDWAATLAPGPAAAPPLANSPDPDRLLTVGYVSSEFRRHHFLAEFLPVLRAHDRSALRVVCYADVAAPDEDTRRVAGLADGFRNLHGLSHEAQARALREDGVDILISLTGYLARDRLLFARRIAPVQATYINHITTAGLETIGHRISDRWLDPSGQRSALDTETPVILASGFSVFAPRADAPPVGPAPALARGYVTFGSFNNLAKVTDESLALWARLLAAVPRSRLLIKARDLSHGEIAAAFAARAVASGIEPARCDLVGFVADAAANQGYYDHADIGLDPVPFTGGATTREMLWAGLPVVTLTGATRAARLGASLLHRAGMSELVARDGDDYVRIATGLAGDISALARRRAGQRDRLAGSPLLDAATHTRELEAAYRRLWQDWCRGAETR